MTCLRTERLILVLVPADQELPPLRTKKAVQSFLAKQTYVDSNTGAYAGLSFEVNLLASQDAAYACFHAKDNVFVGTVTVSHRAESGIYDIGYQFPPKHSGKGYATEATHGVIAWISGAPDFRAVVAETFADWPASIRVMEKLGMTPVDVDLGPFMVRYAGVRDGANVDLGDGATLTFEPFFHPAIFLFTGYLKTIWNRPQEFIGASVIAIFLFRLGVEYWVGFGPIVLAAWLAYLFRGYLYRIKDPKYSELIQFRERGLFWARRDGNGQVLSWFNYSNFRLPKRGGLELWNGDEWYWIPGSAFTSSSLAEARLFLLGHGIVEREPERSWLDA